MLSFLLKCFSKSFKSAEWSSLVFIDKSESVFSNDHDDYICDRKYACIIFTSSFISCGFCVPEKGSNLLTVTSSGDLSGMWLSTFDCKFSNSCINLCFGDSILSSMDACVQLQIIWY